LRSRELRRELVFSLAGGHAWRALTEGSYTHFVISGIARLERRSRELRLANSRDGELRQAPLGIGLGHSVVVAWEKVELAPSVVRTGELPKRTCGSIELRFQQGIKRAASAHKRN
jgi:hypothetical protein